MPTLIQERLLSQRLWELVEPLLPAYKPSPLGGRPRASDRDCFEAIIFVLRSGCRWRDIPSEFPSAATCWRRHLEWTGEGIWEQVWQIVVEELDEAKLLDTDELFADATFTPAQKGDEIGKTKVGKGMKIEIAIDRTGVPIGVLTAPANQAETELLQPVLATIPEGVALPVETPVILDRSYDSDPLRAEMKEENFILISPHRRNRVKEPTNDGRRMRRYKRRWLVERTIAWMHSFRRVTTRHEYYSFIFTGFVHLACALIAISRL